MRLPIFLVLLSASLIGTGIALRMATTVSRRNDVLFATALGGGMALMWLLVAISAFSVVTVSGGSTITNSYPSLGVVGVVGVGVSITILGKGSLELLQ